MKIPPEILDCGAETAIVLGSGLGPFADSLPQKFICEYDKIEGLPKSEVAATAWPARVRMIFAGGVCFGANPHILAWLPACHGWRAGCPFRSVSPTRVLQVGGLHGGDTPAGRGRAPTRAPPRIRRPGAREGPGAPRSRAARRRPFASCGRPPGMGLWLQGGACQVAPFLSSDFFTE